MLKTAITSMTGKYYDEKGGKKCIDTFLEFWPEDIKLVVYWEGHDAPASSERVVFEPMEEVKHLKGFLNAISYFYMMDGGAKYGGGYNIEHDARMCRAAFIHIHALKTYGGKVYWLDADLLTHSKVTHAFLDEVLPDDKLCCCLMRPHFNTETGFLGVNAGHEDSELWLRFWLNAFTSGMIFTQPGWHDNWGFDLARKWFNRDFLFNNLAKDLPEKCMHPLVNSVLGSVFDHLKGNRKNGKSRRDDLVVKRTEPYWND